MLVLVLLGYHLWPAVAELLGSENGENKSVAHEVPEWQAFDTGRELFRQKDLTRSGCSKCSSEDMDYCLSKSLLYDHCCCDNNLPERYPYIAHVCYKDDLPLCQPTAGDCEEFFRLDQCCCQPYLRPQWQFHWWHFSPNEAQTPRTLPATTILLIILTSLIQTVR